MAAQDSPASLDAHTMAVTGDRNAAEALSRTRSAHLEGSALRLRAQNVGAENTTLAGLRLALPALTGDAFAFDLVPVGVVGHAPQLVDGATVYSLYRPDLPAQFRGGHIDLAPSALPDELTVQLAIASGVHLSSTFQDGLGYDGGALDFLGIDDGTRALPDEAPDGALLVPTRRDPPNDDAVRIGRALEPVWQAYETMGLPDLELTARVGDRFVVGAGELRVHAAIYSLNTVRSSDETMQSIAPSGSADGQGVFVRERLSGSRTEHQARLATALRLRWDYAPGYALQTHTWLVSGADDRTALTEGTAEASATVVRSTTLDYVERRVFGQQISGEQRLGAAGAPVLDFRYAFSLATADQPDRRTHDYLEVLSDERFSGATRAFRDRAEIAHDAGLALRVPLLLAIERELNLKIGASLLTRDATLRRRDFRIVQPAGAQFDAPIEELLAPERYDESWRLVESVWRRLQSDTRIYAGFAMLDARWGPVSMLGGARIEHWTLEAVGELPLGERHANETHATDVAPTAQLFVRPIAPVELSAAWSFTVDRPEADQITSIPTVAEVRPSSDLERSHQHAVDLGAQWSLEPERDLGADELGIVVAYQHIAKPIRAQVLPTGDYALMNADYLERWWLELQADKHIGFLGAQFEDAYVALGASIPIVSNERGTAPLATLQGDRDALDTPSHILNARVGYDPARRGKRDWFAWTVAYQSVGARAIEHGTLGFEDLRAEATHVIDAHAHVLLGFNLRVGLSARNVLDLPIEVSQQGIVLSERRLGRAFLLGITWSPTQAVSASQPRTGSE